jgi:ribosomal protein S18 acetylase RimI-like enzyme
MTIQEATTEDIPGIRSVAEASWKHDHPAILSRESVMEGFDEWYGTDRLESEIENPRTQVFVEKAEAGVRGFVHAIVDGDDGVILRLYVHPDHRGEGTGEALFDHTREALEAYSIDRIRAMVLAENTIGNEFYRGLGFEKISEGATRIGDEEFAENLYELQP